MRKVERLVNLIALLLDTRRPLTLDQVAELVPGYDASGESLRRMFERDKEELRGLGVPVERAPIDAWGSEEGYFIDPEAYGMPELDLAPDERAALALAAQRLRWENHPDTALAYNNLAVNLNLQGRYAEAEALGLGAINVDGVMVDVASIRILRNTILNKADLFGM